MKFQSQNAPNPSTHSNAHAALVALLLLIALNLLNYIDRYILPGAQPLIQSEFRVNDEMMGRLTMAFFLTYMLVAPLTGWMGDVFKRKWLIIAGAVLWSIATLATAWVHDYRTLFIRHALVGIGEATFGIYAPSVLADFYPERERNRILSFFYLVIPVGAALGYIAGGMLGTAYGWRAPFFLSAIPGLVIALLYAIFATEPERGACDHIRATADRSTVRGLFRNPAFLTATFGLAALTFAMGGISAWVPTFLNRITGLELGRANLLIGAITVVDGIAGTLTGAWIAQRWLGTNHRALYLLSCWSVLLTLPFGVLAFFGPHQLTVPALFIAEFCLFLNTGPLNAAVVNSVAAPVRATAISINLFVIHCFGDTFSPQIIGIISDKTKNLGTALGFTLVALVASAFILLLGSRFAPPLDETAGAAGT